MKTPSLLRSETARMLLIGFLIGSAGIAATTIAAPSSATIQIATR